MLFFQDNYIFLVLIRVTFTEFVLCQNLSFLSLKQQQLSCVKVSGLQHPSETAVINMAWFHVETGEQIATSRCSLGFLTSSARAVPMGCKRKDKAPAGSDLVRQINLVTGDEISVLAYF